MSCGLQLRPTLHLAAVDQVVAIREAEQLGVVFCELLVVLAIAGERLRVGGGRHRGIVLDAGLADLKGRREVEDRAAFLDADDASGVERLPVANRVDVVDDGARVISRSQEVAVKRVQVALGAYGAGGRDDGLAEDLATKDVRARTVEAAKEGGLELFEIHELDELSERLRGCSHSAKAMRGGGAFQLGSRGAPVAGMTLGVPTVTQCFSAGSRPSRLSSSSMTSSNRTPQARPISGHSMELRTGLYSNKSDIAAA